MTDITAIILTKNEEVNIERCIKSLNGVVDRICVVDSGRTDHTIVPKSSIMNLQSLCGPIQLGIG